MLVHGPEKTGHCWFSSKAILFFSPVGLPIGITFIYFAPRLVHRFEVLGEDIFFSFPKCLHKGTTFSGERNKLGKVNSPIFSKDSFSGLGIHIPK